MSANYVVHWEVDVEADSPRMAAQEAADDYFQERIGAGEPDTACVFKVTDSLTGEATIVDLTNDFAELENVLGSMAKATALTTYTAFCQQASGGGTVWIEQVQAVDLDEAAATAKQACADAWEYDPEDVHVLGIAEGDVNILLWDDLGD